MATVFQLTSWLSGAGGGIPPVIRALAAEYRQRQMDCVVAGLADPTGALPAFPVDWPVLAGRIAGPAAFGYSPELARQMRERVQKDSVIHVHGLWMYPGWLARKLCAETGAVRIVSPHGMLEPWALQNSRWKKRLAAWAFENQNLRTASCLHALCATEAENFRHYGLKNPIVIIPNGIDLPEIGNAETLKTETLKYQSSEIPSPIGRVTACVPPCAPDPLSVCQHVSMSAFTGGRKVLLYLGRIHPKKGLVNLLRAWAEIRKAESGKRKAEEWVLAIAGWDKGGHEDELKRLATELEIPWADVRGKAEKLKTEIRKGESAQSQERETNFRISEFQHVSVLFVGPQFNEDKVACYRNCDAFILPSFSEGLPMVILEAWAHGKPVLMTPECNLPEGFAANAAIRIEPSTGSIAEGLEELFRLSSSDLSSLGSNGRKLVRERFTWDIVGSQLRNVSAWLVGGGARPECVV